MPRAVYPRANLIGVVFLTAKGYNCHNPTQSEVNKMPYAKHPKDFPEPTKLPKRYFEDKTWLRENLNELTHKYPDHWIAVLEKEVVIASKDLDKVKKVARQKAAEVAKGQCVYRFVESFERFRRAIDIRCPSRS